MRSVTGYAVRDSFLRRFSSAITILSAAVVLLGAVSVTQVLAQQENTEEFSRDQLESFAAASLKVEELNAKWMPRLSEADTAEENNEIRSQAMEEMKAAVRDEDLTVPEYNRIYDAVQNDPRIMQLVEEFRQNMQQ